jgi:hypothetical protein
MRYAIIDAGVVSNVVLADAPMGGNWVETEEAGPGWFYDGFVFSAPPSPPPVVPTKAEQEANRKAAYTTEADPLFFMSQRGEATVEEWQAKVAEIKARYPYPEETQA